MSLPVIFRDDFSVLDSSKWEFLEQRAGTVAIINNAIRLLDNRTLNGGMCRLHQAIDHYPLEIEFSFWGSGNADGFSCLFYKDDGYSFGGGVVGMSGLGHSVEFDNYYNSGDPSSRHVALMQNHYQNHLAYANYAWDTGSWRNCLITIYPEDERDRVRVYIDGSQIFTWLGTLNKTYSRFAFISTSGIQSMTTYIGHVEIRGGVPGVGIFPKMGGMWHESDISVKMGGWKSSTAGWINKKGIWKPII